ncbi:hypothetical protein DL95DRAFT_464525 [Leptodontidium sp. 2 PMI_412]|nr:hypothetical protein DL95DRAFT_464525 [Leptodontidium sp. 2 PMI_412]
MVCQFGTAEANESVLQLEPDVSRISFRQHEVGAHNELTVTLSTRSRSLLYLSIPAIAILAITKTHWMYGPATLQNPFNKSKWIGRLLWIEARRPFIMNYFKAMYFLEYLERIRQLLAFANDRAAVVDGPFLDDMNEGFKDVTNA